MKLRNRAAILNGVLNPFRWRKFRASRRGLPSHVELLADIDLRSLHDRGIRGIILDLDNTIVSEDDRYLAPLAVDWVDRAQQTGFKLVILSNGKRAYRVQYWSNRLNIPALHPARKPFPKIFRQALWIMQLNPKQTLVVGDSLHTDKLGAWLIGCPMIQVASLPHPKRWWEKFIGRYVHRAYPYERGLVRFPDFDVND